MRDAREHRAQLLLKSLIEAVEEFQKERDNDIAPDFTMRRLTYDRMIEVKNMARDDPALSER